MLVVQISKHYHTKKSSENLQNNVQMLKKNFKCVQIFYFKTTWNAVFSWLLFAKGLQASVVVCENRWTIVQTRTSYSH